MPCGCPADKCGCLEMMAQLADVVEEPSPPVRRIRNAAETAPSVVTVEDAKASMEAEINAAINILELNQERIGSIVVNDDENIFTVVQMSNGVPSVTVNLPRERMSSVLLPIIPLNPVWLMMKTPEPITDLTAAKATASKFTQSFFHSTVVVNVSVLPVENSILFEDAMRKGELTAGSRVGDNQLVYSNDNFVETVFQKGDGSYRAVCRLEKKTALRMLVQKRRAEIKALLEFTLLKDEAIILDTVDDISSGVKAAMARDLTETVEAEYIDARDFDEDHEAAEPDLPEEDAPKRRSGPSRRALDEA